MTRLRVKIGDNWHSVEVVDPDADPIEVIVDGEPVMVELPETGGGAEAPRAVETALPEPKEPAPPPAAPAAHAGPIKVFTSPMPGIIVSVAVAKGDQVVPGDEVCVLEAMKMQQTLRAEWAGIVGDVHVGPGQQVQGGDPIATLQ